MSTLSRRSFLIGASAVTAACSTGHTEAHIDPSPRRPGAPISRAAASPKPKISRSGRLIGDGSTSDTGPQPNQPRWTPLKPGETPPQFVVFSWDGAASLDTGLFPRFRHLARDHGAAMTFFLSGIYALPERHRRLYHPPRHRIGASDIEFLTTKHVIATMQQVRKAWLEGHEIGTHFNGHFCGANGVSRWSSSDWADEIAQAKHFVKTWRTTTGTVDDPDLRPLPFDYEKELVGARTPCLEGQENLLPAAKDLGWRYDASSPGGAQVWPSKKHGLWNLPLQAVPFTGAPAPRRARAGMRCPWTTTLCISSPEPTPTATPASGPDGVLRPATPTSPASRGLTPATARRSSSATTSSSGTGAFTWTRSRIPCAKLPNAPVCRWFPSASWSTGSMSRTLTSWPACAPWRPVCARPEDGKHSCTERPEPVTALLTLLMRAPRRL